MLKNLILDWSGTVVDDLDAVIRGTNHVLTHFKKPELTRSEFRQKFSLPWLNFYKQWLPDIPREGLDKIFWEVMLKEQEQIGLLPYAMEFLNFACQNHQPIYICSTVDPQSFWGQANRLQVTPFIRKAYVGIVDKKSVIHQILEENQLDPAETLFVGDMVHDVETAKHGGVRSCAVLTGYDEEQKLSIAKPDLVVRDLRDLRLILESWHVGIRSQPIVTVGALILNLQKECLMVKTQKWSQKWGIPGGKIRRGETAEAALLRECLEETNLKIYDIRFAMVQDCIEPDEFYQSAHFLLLNYFANTKSLDVKLNDEAQMWQWIEPAKALLLDLNRPTRVLLEHYLS